MPRVTKEEALRFLGQVKRDLGRPAYLELCNMMKSFRDGKFSHSKVTRRALRLVQGHPDLVQGFRRFLYPGCPIKQPRPSTSRPAGK